MRTTWSVLLALFVATLYVVSPTSALAAVDSSITGSGVVVLPPGFPVAAFVGDKIQVELTARQLPDGSLQGEIGFHHHSRNGGLVAELHGAVTCLSVVGNRANATAVIDQGRLFENPTFNPAGQIAAVSVLDDRPDMLGFDLSFFPSPHAIASCQPAPALFPLVAGDFTFHG